MLLFHRAARMTDQCRKRLQVSVKFLYCRLPDKVITIPTEVQVRQTNDK